MTPIPLAGEAGSSTPPPLLHTTQYEHRSQRIAWIILVVGLMVTVAATLYMKSSLERIAEQEFTSQCTEIQNIITNRLHDHARILQSGAALFEASESVTRKKWHIFTRHQKFEKQLPGILGIGFSLVIPRKELTRHILKIRREGFPEYKLKPDGDREVYSSIIYLEPFSGRNLRAFGYDMLSEPVRRAAMEQARDTGAAMLSGKVVLVQETSRDVQSGTLMYIPVYRKDMPIATVEQRRSAIYGWVYSPYRMNDLMQGILSGRNLEIAKQLYLQVFDGGAPSPQSLLFECHPAGDHKLRPEDRLTRQIPVVFNGQQWTLRFTHTGSGLFSEECTGIWFTMASGMSITFLLFALFRALLNTRVEAQRMVEQRTEELRKTSDKLQRLNEQLEQRIAEEVHKNREKDILLLHQEKMSSLGQLAAGVAHEINNPMAFIVSNLWTLKGYMETLSQFYSLFHGLVEKNCGEEEQGILRETTRKLDITFIMEDIGPLIAESTEGADRVKRIVHDLKDFARAEDSTIELVDLNACVRSTINIVRHEIKYVADLDLQLGEIPHINCSRHQISQVIINLVVNAVQSIKDHGSIVVATSQEGGHVILVVSDTGHGMPEEVKKRVFDPFFTTKDVGAGIGLGLSISYSIIKRHGGEITVESEPGKGTAFTVRLPINNHQEIVT